MIKKRILLFASIIIATPILAGCASFIKKPPITANRLAYVAKVRMAAGVKYIRHYAGMPPAPAKYFGYNYIQLHQIAFNITDTQYYSQIQSAASGVCNEFGNSSDIVSASGTIVANFTSFWDMTNNQSALYSIVNSYYSKALIARFGEIKTSFLKNAGIPANLDISYTTILRRSNIFLSYIGRNAQNTDRFATLTGVDFLKWKKNRNFICDVSRFAPVVKKLEYFYTPDTNTINFYSLTYYLLSNIYGGSGGNKKFSKKLFAYITLGRYNMAHGLFDKIYAPASISGNTGGPHSLKRFLYLAKKGYSSSNIQKMQNIENHFYWRFFVSVLFLGNPKYKGDYRKDELIYKMEAVVAAMESMRDIMLHRKTNFTTDRAEFTNITNKEIYAEETDMDNSQYFECLANSRAIKQHIDVFYNHYCRHSMPVYP